VDKGWGWGGTDMCKKVKYKHDSLCLEPTTINLCVIRCTHLYEHIYTIIRPWCVCAYVDKYRRHQQCWHVCMYTTSVQTKHTRIPWSTIYTHIYTHSATWRCWGFRVLAHWNPIPSQNVGLEDYNKPQHLLLYLNIYALYISLYIGAQTGGEARRQKLGPRCLLPP
jgi:hypothetical protein